MAQLMPLPLTACCSSKYGLVLPFWYQLTRVVSDNNYYYYNYTHFTALWILSGTTRVSRYQKGKTITNVDFLEQETISDNVPLNGCCSKGA